MSAAWKTIRVFISSTFRDMHAERDHLVRVVFPELRERCATRRLHLVDVDLRWGVTEEDAQRGKALEICLHEIEDCRPFFVGLLGERYGWVSPRYDIPDEPAFDRLRGVEPGHSITALEIYQGVLNNPHMHTRAFFYFRDPTFIEALPPDQRSDFTAEDDDHAQKLKGLKQQIRASGMPVREGYRYDDLDGWGRHVLDDLWQAIQIEYPEDAPEPDPLDAERAYHDFFIETRTQLFIGQRHLLARLHEHAAGDRPGPMVVVGTPGSGKSALLARFVDQLRRLEPDTFLLYHFIGASPRSTDPRQMLLRLCRELARRFGFEDEIPDDYYELRVRFWQFCQRAAERGRVVLVIDALNQLDETYHAHELDWLPALVPPGLRLMLSTLEGDTLEAARRKYQKRREVIITSLRLVDQGFIVARQLQQARKRLTSARKYRLSRAQRLARGEPVPAGEDRSQLRFILTGVYGRRGEPAPREAIRRETANPLYLRLVTEELRLFGRFDRLGDFIARLPVDVPGMFHKVLDRLEHDHGRQLVEHSLSLIVSGRYGLLEGELLELLARPGEARFPMALWSRLYRNLAFYMKPRASAAGDEEGLIDFFHRQLAKVVADRYLPTDQTRLVRHGELASYFRRKGDPDGDDTWQGNYPRSLSELVSQQIAGQLWDDVEKALTALFFLEANVGAGRVFELAKDLSTAVSALPEHRPQRRILKLLNEALRRDIHFIARHAKDYPQGLFQCLWNNGWWYDCDEAAQHYEQGRAPGLSPPAKGKGATAEGSPLPTPARGGEAGSEGSPAPVLPANAPRLCDLLERWRDRKEQATPSFRWLRSHRPPQMHLGTAQLAVLRGHEHGVTSVAFSPQEDRIASGSKDKTVRVWDAQSGTELAVLRGHTDGVMSVAFSPQGDRIASGGNFHDKTVRVWDAQSGAELAVLGGLAHRVEDVAFSPLGHQGEVTSVAFSPDGQRIASGGGFTDATVRVWDAQSGTELAVLRGHEHGVTSVAFSPQEDRIASGSQDATVRVWDAQSCAELAVLGRHSHGVLSVAFSPDGGRIASGGGGKDKTVRVWDAQSGTELAVLRGHTDGVSSVAFSRDGRRIVSGSLDKTVRVWDAASGAELICLRGNEEWVPGVTFSPDGRWIVSGSEDKTVRLWDAADGAEMVCLRRNDESVWRVAFSPEGRRIVSGSEDKIVRVWDAQSGTELAVLRGHTDGVISVAFSHDGRRIVSGSWDKTVRVWDAQSGTELAVLRGHTDGVISVAFSPQGDRIASGSWSNDKTVRVWDAQSGTELVCLRGNEGSVPGVAFCPDGRRIVSGSWDKTVRVWDTQSGTELAVLRGHTDGVFSVAFSPDGGRIVSGGGWEDKVVRVWDAQSGAELEVIDGAGDVCAIAAGPFEFSYRALARTLETVIEQSGDGRIVAWFPVRVLEIMTCPSGRTWVGTEDSHLQIITLEG